VVELVLDPPSRPIGAPVSKVQNRLSPGPFLLFLFVCLVNFVVKNALLLVVLLQNFSD
jgi:hypothetical protein